MMGHRNDGSLKVEVTGVTPSPFQCILPQDSAYCHYSAISGTATGTLLSIMIAIHTLH